MTTSRRVSAQTGLLGLLANGRGTYKSLIRCVGFSITFSTYLYDIYLYEILQISVGNDAVIRIK